MSLSAIFPLIIEIKKLVSLDRVGNLSGSRLLSWGTWHPSSWGHRSRRGLDYRVPSGKEHTTTSTALGAATSSLRNALSASAMPPVAAAEKCCFAGSRCRDLQGWRRRCHETTTTTALMIR